MQNHKGQEIPQAGAELYFPCGFLVLNETTEIFFEHHQNVIVVSFEFYFF